MRNRILIYACVSSVLLVYGNTAFAQDETKSTSPRLYEIETRPTNCEFHIATLDAAHNKAGKDTMVIVIARLGDREQRRDLNRRRLHNVRAYLRDFAERDSKTIITGEGDRVKGYGRVELYVEGKLFYTLMIKPNSDLTVGSCSYDGEDPCTLKQERKLYPCLSK